MKLVQYLFLVFKGIMQEFQSVIHWRGRRHPRQVDQYEHGREVGNHPVGIGVDSSPLIRTCGMKKEMKMKSITSCWVNKSEFHLAVEYRLYWRGKFQRCLAYIHKHLSSLC